MRLIARSPRKIDARRGVFALLAAVALLGACAQLESHRESHRSPAHHQVRAGETLGSIAAGYGVSVDRLARANGLRDADRIAPGRRLRLPDGARIVHRVRRGETLEKIASRYRVRVSTIASLNRLGRSPRLEVGQRLVLPREARLPAPTPEPPPAIARPAAAPTAPPAIDPNVERARKLVDRSVEDYHSARFERALERSREAEAMLAQSEDQNARSLSARAVFVTGSSLAALGETDRAKAAFARVHALDPHFEPPKGWLSPRLEALYPAARSD